LHFTFTWFPRNDKKRQINRELKEHARATRGDSVILVSIY